MSQIDRTDGLVGNAAIKYPCRMASTANLVLSGLQTIDAVVGAAGDRVLVKNQTTGAENGIYVMDTGDWERAQDADNDGAFTEGSLVKVNNGTAGIGFWYVTNTGTITIDTTALTFAQASGTLAYISLAWQAVVSKATLALGLTEAGFSAFVQTLIAAATALAFRQLLILDVHGADIVAAANVNLDTATGDVVDVTGNTAITSITLTEGVEKTVRFTGTPIITHGASLVLPGAANIVAIAGSYAVFRGYAAGVVRMVSYTIGDVAPFDRRAPGAIGATTPAAGTFAALSATSAAGTMVATQSDQETATSTTTVVSPGRQQYHPSAAKAWCQAGVAGNIVTSYNVTSVTDSNIGDALVNLTTAFSSANYCAVQSAKMDSGNGVCSYVGATSSTASAVRSLVRDTTNATVDPTNHMVIAFGDQ